MRVLSEITTLYSVNECKIENRNDPYYYNKAFFDVWRKLEQLSNLRIGDIFYTFTGISPPGKYDSSGIPFIRIQDLSPFGVDITKTVKIDLESINSSNVIMVTKYDILLAITGATIGKVSIYLEDKPAICTSDILILRPKQEISIKEIFGIYALFLTDTYLKIFKRGVTGVSNQHLNPKYVKRIPIILNEKILDIGDKLKQAIEAKIEAEKKRKEIEEIFERYISLKLTVAKDLSTIYNLQTAKKNERIDPKHFSRELLIYEKKLIESGLRLERLKDLCKSQIRRGIQPVYDEFGEIPVIKTGDVYDGPIRWETTSKVNKEFYLANRKAQVPKNALVITSTGEGSWGRTSINTQDQAFADGHISIVEIDETKIDPYYVCAFLWTPYGKAQYERRVRGCTGQTEIYPKDLETILIPRLDTNDELEIAKKMRELFESFYKSENLRSQAMNELNKLLELNSEGDIL